MMNIQERLVVDASEAGGRLDKWIAERLQELDYDVSRSMVQTWLDLGYVEGPRAKLKASDLVTESEGYAILVPSGGPLRIEGDDIPVSVVYEDEDVIVVDKPRGMVVHPAAGHARGTLVNALVGRGSALSELGGEMRPGVVHRIDKDTSGLVMFAKSDLAYHKLTEQLREHTVHRVYQAIVHGRLTHDSGLIDAPIGRDARNRQRMAVTDSGKHAVTHFRVIERFRDSTYLELKLETGRTHQIRVHLAYIGHPLAGDPVYGRRHTLPIDGQALHAAELGFEHPRSHATVSFTSPVPEDMARLLSGLENDLY